MMESNSLFISSFPSTRSNEKQQLENYVMKVKLATFLTLVELYVGVYNCVHMYSIVDCGGIWVRVCVCLTRVTVCVRTYLA